LRTVERAVRPWRQPLEAEARATVRFETPPGRQLQIDFGTTTVRIGEEPVVVRLFVATCVPGMARSESGASPDTRCTQSRRLAEGQGRRREAGSGGSPRQNRGAMNKNRIRGVVHPGRAGT